MSRTAAVIENGVVVNMIVVEDGPRSNNEIDVTDLPTVPGIGWTFAGDAFTPPRFPPAPPPPDPLKVLQASIDALQARIAVLEATANVATPTGP